MSISMMLCKVKEGGFQSFQRTAFSSRKEGAPENITELERRLQQICYQNLKSKSVQKIKI
jgi:hypothetical protein